MVFSKLYLSRSRERLSLPTSPCLALDIVGRGLSKNNPLATLAFLSFTSKFITYPVLAHPASTPISHLFPRSASIVAQIQTSPFPLAHPTGTLSLLVTGSTVIAYLARTGVARPSFLTLSPFASTLYGPTAPLVMPLSL